MIKNNVNYFLKLTLADYILWRVTRIWIQVFYLPSTMKTCLACMQWNSLLYQYLQLSVSAHSKASLGVNTVVTVTIKLNYSLNSCNVIFSIKASSHYSTWSQYQCQQYFSVSTSAFWRNQKMHTNGICDTLNIYHNLTSLTEQKYMYSTMSNNNNGQYYQKHCSWPNM